jgi:hypothetical protein
MDANKLWKVGAYICILTAASLKGHEGFYVELAGLRRHIAKGRVGEVPPGLNKSTLLTEEACKKLPHITVCLLGKFKGETGSNHHLIALANEAVSGLEPQRWIKKLITVCESEGREQGPALTRTRPHPLPRPTRGAAGHHAKQEEPAAAHWSHTSSTCWHTTQALHSQWVM